MYPRPEDGSPALSAHAVQAERLAMKSALEYLKPVITGWLETSYCRSRLLSVAFGA